ncbi:sodium/solute symporter [Prevotella sp. PINT]|jgi:transporter, SSS family|uniref:sodium:solute symporter family transporter n=1 Tax=Palleniella intestinalis TaxID=2736291 RepID=UPI001556CD64|nr:sodium/solute symporter [Palleniella intestinalis]NPD80635.1 sodium/solute symporter [Palleniella intestinalis]
MSVIEALQNNGFATIDYVVFAAYIVLLVGLGIFLSRGKKGEEKSSTDYFLAGNTLTWWAVGASLIAANISAEQFIGMSGSAFASGIAQAAYELMAAATLLVVGKFLLPLMIEKKIFTIPQFLRERYNWGVGLAFSLLWLFLYVFVNLTSVAWLGALAIQQILGLPTDMIVQFGGMEIDQVRMVIILVLFVIAGLYSIYGGLASVAWTDVMQVTFLVGGGLITAYAALSVIGAEVWGCGALEALGNIYSWCIDQAGDKHFNLVVTRNEELYPVINGVVENGVTVQKEDPYFTNPGIVLIFGALWLTNLGYWGFNQYIIQKGLAAKSLAEAKKGMIFAAFLKILIPFIVCIPGVCAFYIMNGDGEALEALRQTLAGGIERSDDAYPFLIRNFTPTFVKGLSFAALAAAVISSLASMFNSTSTLFTMDIYKQFINKNASEKQLVNVGRLTSVSALLIALVAVYPLMGGIDQAFQFIQEYSAFVYPGVVVIFGLGLLWKRASGAAAVAAAFGTFFFSILFKFTLPDVPFLIRSGYVFIVLTIMFVTISLYSNKAVKADELSEKTIKTQLFWSKALYAVSVLSIVVLVMSFFNETLTIHGVQGAMIFFAAITATIGFYLRSNALDKVQDPKLVAIDLDIFKTDKAFNIGAAGVIIILTILYIVLW